MKTDRLSRRELFSAGSTFALLGLSGCLRLTDGEESTVGTTRNNPDRSGTSQDVGGKTTSAAASPPTEPSTDTVTRSPADRTTTQASTRTETPTDTPTETPTDTPTETPTDTPTETPTATPTERPSVFSDIRIEEEDLVIELNENRASEISTIRIDFPTKNETKDVSGFTVTQIDLLGEYHRYYPGTWTIEALTGGGAVVESTEYETEFNISISDIGTLAELGVIGDDIVDEHTTMQLTLTNDGQMPIDLVDGLDEFSSTYGYDYEISGDYAMESRHETTVLGNESIDLQYNFVLSDDVPDLAGDTYQASLTIRWSARGSKTVPLNISFGDNVKYGPGRGDTAYAEGTTVSKR